MIAYNKEEYFEKVTEIAYKQQALIIELGELRELSKENEQDIKKKYNSIIEQLRTLANIKVVKAFDE